MVEEIKTNTFAEIRGLQSYLNKRILGQQDFVNRMLIALLADGHLLVEGAPGLAKTKAVRVLSECIEGDFHRVQFTPDLLPGDLTGTDIYRPQDGSFVFQQGPLFHHLILADEINRAPAKVQSALLEAMAERQVTIGHQTYPLPELFMVMATQNPIEQEGTYPLPEAQLDRFLMYIKVDYPDAAVEKEILGLGRREASQKKALAPLKALSQKTIFKAREEILDVYLSDALEDYLLNLVLATRDPKPYSKTLASYLLYGVSPRATLALDRCAKAHAWLQGRDHVVPEDIHAVLHEVFRHRLILSFEAEAEGLTTDLVIDELVKHVALP